MPHVHTQMFTILFFALVFFMSPIALDTSEQSLSFATQTAHAGGPSGGSSDSGGGWQSPAEVQVETLTRSEFDSYQEVTQETVETRRPSARRAGNTTVVQGRLNKTGHFEVKFDSLRNDSSQGFTPSQEDYCDKNPEQPRCNRGWNGSPRDNDGPNEMFNNPLNPPPPQKPSAPNVGLVVSNNPITYDTRANLVCSPSFNGQCSITAPSEATPIPCNNEQVASSALQTSQTFTYTCIAGGSYRDAGTEKTATAVAKVDPPQVRIEADAVLVRSGEQVTISWYPQGFETVEGSTCTLTPTAPFNAALDEAELRTAGSALATQEGQITYTYSCTAPDGTFGDPDSSGVAENTTTDSVTVRVLPMLEET